jgi:Ca-activated chloride channel family protein
MRRNEGSAGRFMALIAVLYAVFATTTIVAQSNNPPAPAPPADAKKSGPADPGVRKLSRRERKDKIKSLPEAYRQFLQEVEPIMLPTELDTFLILETDPQRDIFITEFWRRRDVASGTTNHAFKDEYYSRMDEAKTRFKQLSSDRGRIFLIQGEPAEVLDTDCDRLLQPIQIWKYLYIPGLGHEVRFLFYIPRNQNDYKLWTPGIMSGQTDALADLVAQDAMGTSTTSEGAVQRVFYESASPYTNVSKIETTCKFGDEILRAIFQMQQNTLDLHKVYEPPQVNEEDVHKMLRSVVLATPNAPKLEAGYDVHFPAKQGTKTDAEITLLVPRAQLLAKEVGNTKTYSLDVVGEILKDDQLFENYRYRFDFPADTKDEKLTLVVDRFLRPNGYKARIKVSDSNSGAEALIEKDLTVPELFDTPEQQRQKAAASEAVAQIKDDIDSNATRLRIVPLPDDLLSGLQHIETLAVGDDIKAVEFYLDKKRVMVKRQPPYTLDLDFGNVPQVRHIRAVALNDKGEILTGDELAVNTGNDPFRVRIVSPRVAPKAKGRTRVEMSVRLPEGKKLDNIQLFLNETRVATMYDPPFVQNVNLPDTAGIGYLRAVATLKDDPAPPVEDVVMINTPEFMEEVNVHLVELPTTVAVNGKPVSTLSESSFKVLDEGKPIKISKFEYVKNLPLAIGMAIDTSGSMLPRMNEAQKAGAQFLTNVMKQGDKAFLVAFSTEPQLVQKWSPRLADVNAGLAKLRAEESTALYDAIVYSLYNFIGQRGQKALIVITDGKDTASRFNYDQALEYARRAAVPIYGIGIGIRPTEVDVRYKFGKFCTETGGNVYYIDQAFDLHRIYDDIQNELRSQYVLGFYPPEGVKPGSKWREISVQASEGKAKTIRGYYP